MFKKSSILGALGTLAALAVLGSTVPVAVSPAHASTVCATFLPSNPPPDAVRINRVNFDFGGDAGLDENNDAENCGTLTWDLANGTIKPRLTGTLYAKNSIGTTVRMSLRHRDVDGTLLHTTNNQPQEVFTDGLEEFPINLFGYSSPLIYRVDVELQQETSADVWEVKGSQTVYIGSSTKSPDSVRLLGVGEEAATSRVARRPAAGPSRGTWPTTRLGPGSRATCTCRTATARTFGCGCATTTSTGTTSVAASPAVRSRRRTVSRRSPSTWPPSAARRSTRPRSRSRSTSSGRGPRPTPRR
jgi:hypothetical protein